MFKRLSVISVVICLIAVLSGAVFVPVQSAAYEFINGPRLITKDIDRLTVASPGRAITSFDKDSRFKGVIYRGIMDAIGIVNELENGIVVQTEVTKINNNRFKLNTWMFPKKKEKTPEFKEFSRKHKPGISVFDTLEANRRIDELHFPDEESRVMQKKMLKMKIEQFFKDPHRYSYSYPFQK